MKVFATRKRGSSATATATSGSDYLRKKAEALQSSSTQRKDKEIEQFVADLAAASSAATAGGKASAGQPNLAWSGSFLVKQSQEQQFGDVLRRYAEKWGDTRQVEASGPWPPYSFVGEHGN